MKKRFLLACTLYLSACNHQSINPIASNTTSSNDLDARFHIYAPVDLSADISELNAAEKKMLSILIDAAQIMDDLFWQQAYGDKKVLLDGISDPAARRFAEINYGPWDRLDNNRPFIPGFGPKPAGANFYPPDMSKEEFNAAVLPGKDGLYSLVRRDSNGKLILIPYRKAYAQALARAAQLLNEAADLAEDTGFKKYLQLRAHALLSDDYYASDLAWMDMKHNRIELVIGPIETYEDKLFGYRATFEAFVLIKDLEWSQRLARFAALLPTLQKNLPVPSEYKQETSGNNADLNAYDAVYYAGDSNAGSKTIAINLPNDETVQLQKGTRRLQLKNAMRAKFDKIMLPIGHALIAPTQRRHLTFDAFFNNTMFHEVAHGLGIKNIINGKGTVRDALQEAFSPLEEGKADVLGLYMITELHKNGELQDSELMDNYVTFLAGIFRSVRFGAASAHGQANMVRFNFFREHHAFARDPDSGYYRVDFNNMQKAITALSRLILTLQGDGDYASAKKLLEDKGHINLELQADLNRLAQANIPVDIVFRQGKALLQLQ